MQRRFWSFISLTSRFRYEAAYPSGVSHFLEKLSFGVTEKFGGRDDIMQKMEKFGGIFDCQTHRDTALYAASVDSRDGAQRLISNLERHFSLQGVLAPCGLFLLTHL